MTLDWSCLYTLTKLAYKTHSREDTNIYMHNGTTQKKIYLEKHKKSKCTVTFLLFSQFVIVVLIVYLTYVRNFFFFLQLTSNSKDTSVSLAVRRWAGKNTWSTDFVSIIPWDQMSVSDQNLLQCFTFPYTFDRLSSPLLHSRTSTSI